MDAPGVSLAGDLLNMGYLPTETMPGLRGENSGGDRLAFQKDQHAPLITRKPFGAARQLQRIAQSGLFVAIFHKFDNGRVNIGFAGYGGGIAQMLRDHGAEFGYGQNFGHLKNCFKADRGGGPGPEVLGGEFLAHRFMQVIVDFARPDWTGSALFVDELEQVLARKILHRLYEADQLSVAKAQFAHSA